MADPQDTVTVTLTREAARDLAEHCRQMAIDLDAEALTRRKVSPVRLAFQRQSQAWALRGRLLRDALDG